MQGFFIVMMKIEIKGLKELQESIDDHIARQIPFIAAKSLTMTAKDLQADLKHEMTDSFDRPTPYTLNSTYIQAASKSKLEATVGFKTFGGKGIPAGKYLLPQVFGGVRPLKRFEKALRSIGVLPSNHIVVPGSGVQLDSYGNIPRSLIVQILSYFKAFGEQGYRANMTDKRRKSLARGTKTKQGVSYFVSKGGVDKFAAGIWARYQFSHGSAVKPIMMFVPYPVYEQRLDFFYVMRKSAEKHFEKNLKETFGQVVGSGTSKG